MVGYDVHDHFHVALAHFGDQVYIFFVAAKPRIDFVIVGDRIAMETFFGLVVGLNGVEPQCCDAQFFEIVEFAFHARQIAAMSGFQSAAIHTNPVLHIGVVVIGLAIGESVRKNEVGDIVRG